MPIPAVPKAAKRILQLEISYLSMNRQRYTTCYYHLLLSVGGISGMLGTAVPPAFTIKQSTGGRYNRY